MKFIKIRQLRWEYEVEGRRYPFSVTDELEFRLKRYYKTKDIETLNGVDITRVFAELLGTHRPEPAIIDTSAFTEITFIVERLTSK